MDKPLEILTVLQREVLNALFAEEKFAKTFYLTGGTALSAFYLKHRYSEDLDFFTHESQMEFLWPILQLMADKYPYRVDTRMANFVRLQFKDELKVDFVRDIAFRVGVPEIHGSWRIDNLANITVNKVAAILGRFEPKDYVDLYFLLQDSPDRILKLMGEAKKKDTGVDPFVWSRIIADAENIKNLPQMILPIKLDALKQFYRDLSERILISLKPR
jgi:predicted nucleotidyltransferase component of viral defense system